MPLPEPRRELVDRVAELEQSEDPVQVATALVLAAVMGLERKHVLMVMTQVRAELARAFFGSSAGAVLDASDERVLQGRQLLAVTFPVSYDGNRCAKCFEVHGPERCPSLPATITLVPPRR